MDPINYKLATWADVQARVVGLRLDVWRALHQHGACTTRELARKSGIDLLTVRPRVTELVQLGLVECLPVGGNEGVYRALSETDAMARFESRRAEALRGVQAQFAF